MVTKVGYRGYEPVEHLAVVALLEPRDREASSTDYHVLSEHQARALLDAAIRDRPALEPPSTITEEDLEDALEDAFLSDQMRVEGHEQQRFAHMIDQIECFIGDRTQVLERHRRSVSERVAATEQRRDGALSSDRRSAAERDLVRLHGELEQLDADLVRLESRDDDDYQHWRTRAHERRATAPVRATVLDVHFVLEPRGDS